MKKNYTKIVVSVVLTICASVGIIYATQSQVLTLFDTAEDGSLLTHQWVNAVNNKLGTADADSSDIVTALNNINTTLVWISTKMDNISFGGDSGTSGEIFDNLTLLNTNNTAAAFCKSHDFMHYDIRSTSNYCGEFSGRSTDGINFYDGSIYIKYEELDSQAKQVCYAFENAGACLYGAAYNAYDCNFTSSSITQIYCYN